MTTDRSFSSALERLAGEVRGGPLREGRGRWQGRPVDGNPLARTREVLNARIEVDLGGCMDLDHWRKDIRPNLPWADDHFGERVGGEPLNPGVQWANWPWGRSAAGFRGKDELFNHTYMERLWPKYARATPGGRIKTYRAMTSPPRRVVPGAEAVRGIAGEYGDLVDLVDLLVRDPETRQAWIPLFFPEDTGWADGGRKPCTLGYQILRRDDAVHMYYPLRSCDIVHHLRDDCYLAVRLLLWVIDRCRERSSGWAEAVPGTYSMHMTSLHAFESSIHLLDTA